MVATAWASGEYSTLASFEGSQSGSSSIGILGPRMEWPGSPCEELDLSLGGASLAATWGTQWSITCLVTRL